MISWIIEYRLQVNHEPDPFPAHAETLTKLGLNIVVEIGLNSEREPEVGDRGADSLQETPVVITRLPNTPRHNGSFEADDAFIKTVASIHENGIDISFEE